MKNLITILLLFVASQTFAQKITGTYYVNNNPKNIVKILYDERNEQYAIISDSWEGYIENYDEAKKMFVSQWRYPIKTKNPKLRGLEGTHIGVVGAKGIINVQIIPKDDSMPAGTVKWYPAKK